MGRPWPCRYSCKRDLGFSGGGAALGQIQGGGCQFVSHVDGDEFTGGFHALVEIDGGYYGFDCGGQHRILVAPAGGFYAAPHPQQLSQTPASGYLSECLSANQPRAGLGHFTFVSIREMAVEVSRHSELEDGVAEELQALVGSGGVQPMLIAVGTVDEGVTEKAGVPESEPQQRVRVAGWGSLR